MRIVVLSRKGGVGKSTTAIHLGGYLAEVFEGGDDVLLVDTDPSRNALRWAKRGRLPFRVVGGDKAQSRNALGGARRGRLPFRVVGEDEVDADPTMARDAKHLIVDMR